MLQAALGGNLLQMKPHDGRHKYNYKAYYIHSREAQELSELINSSLIKKKKGPEGLSLGQNSA